MADNLYDTDKELNNDEIPQNGTVTVGTPPKAPAKKKKAHGYSSGLRIKRNTVSNKVTILEGKRSGKEAAPILTIVVVAAVMVLALFMLLNYAELEKLTTGISELEAEITTLKTEKKTLENELETAQDLVFIEKYATEVLGMEKPTKKFPISLLPDDDTNITEYEPEDKVEVTTVFSTFGEFFRNFLNKAES